MAEGVRRSSRLRGVRTRVVVGYVVLLAASLGIVLLVVRQALLARLDRAVDEALAQEVEELRLLAGGTDPGTGEPFGTDATAVLRVFLQRSVPAANEAFYTFVDGEPFQRSFGAPVAVLDDAALVDAWTSATTIDGLSPQSTFGEAMTAEAMEAEIARARSGWSASVISPLRATSVVTAPVSGMRASPRSSPPTSRASSPKVVGIERKSFSSSTSLCEAAAC